MSGMYPLLQKKQIKSVQVIYIWYLKYLLYLPSSYCNHSIVSKYGAMDITDSFERLNTVLADNAVFSLGCLHLLVRLFCHS